MTAPAPKLPDAPGSAGGPKPAGGPEPAAPRPAPPPTAEPKSAGGPWSLPNLLTYGRVAAVPVVVALLFYPDENWMRWAALGVFSAAGITDFLDGYLARLWGQQSSLGRMLDPIADKLLVSSALFVLTANGTLYPWHVWAGIVSLCREILVSGLREFLAELRVPLPVSWVAKWKTTAQILALGFLIAGPAGEEVLPGTLRIGFALLWLSAVLTLYTGWDYMKAGMRHAT